MQSTSVVSGAVQGIQHWSNVTGYEYAHDISEGANTGNPRICIRK